VTLPIIASALILLDAVLSGLLEALCIYPWRLHAGVEVNPVLRWLGDKWAADPRWRWAWAGYWGVFVALAWVLPEPVQTWYCIAASAASLFGIGSIIYARRH